MFSLHRPALNFYTSELEHCHYQTSYLHGLFGLDFLFTVIRECFPNGFLNLKDFSALDVLALSLDSMSCILQ